MLDRLVRVAEYLRETTGRWPAEILVKGGCGVPTIEVIERPQRDLSLVAWESLPMLADMPRRITIPIGIYWTEAPVWAYREGWPGGELREFFPPR